MLAAYPILKLISIILKRPFIHNLDSNSVIFTFFWILIIPIILKLSFVIFDYLNTHGNITGKGGLVIFYSDNPTLATYKPFIYLAIIGILLYVLQPLIYSYLFFPIVLIQTLDIGVSKLIDIISGRSQK